MADQHRTPGAPPSAPAVIPVDFVTRAGYLLQKGGYDTRGKLPSTINSQVDKLREQAEPAVILHFVTSIEECLGRDTQTKKKIKNGTTTNGLTTEGSSFVGFY